MRSLCPIRNLKAEFMVWTSSMVLQENGMMSINNAKNFQKIHKCKEFKEKELSKKSIQISLNAQK